MFGIIVSVLILTFGIFLKMTNVKDFQSSKRFSVMFIILGISALVAKFILMYLASK